MTIRRASILTGTTEANIRRGIIAGEIELRETAPGRTHVRLEEVERWVVHCQSDPDGEWLGLREGVRRTGISQATLVRAIRAGQIKACEDSTRTQIAYLISTPSLDKWAQARQNPTFEPGRHVTLEEAMALSGATKWVLLGDLYSGALPGLKIREAQFQRWLIDRADLAEWMKKHLRPDSRLISVQEAARRAGVPESRLRNAIRTGHLKVRKARSSCLIEPDGLESWIAGLSRSPHDFSPKMAARLCEVAPALIRQALRSGRLAACTIEHLANFAPDRLLVLENRTELIRAVRRGNVLGFVGSRILVNRSSYEAWCGSPTVNLEEAMRQGRISYRRLRPAIEDGHVRAFREGQEIRIDRDDLQRWLSQLGRPETQEAPQDLEVINLTQAAGVASLSTTTLAQAIKKGELEAYRLPKEWRVSTESLARWMAQRETRKS